MLQVILLPVALQVSVYVHEGVVQVVLGGDTLPTLRRAALLPSLLQDACQSKQRVRADEIKGYVNPALLPVRSFGAARG